MPPSMASMASTSCRTALTNHTGPISHHITPLVINVLIGADAHTYQHVNKNDFKKPGVHSKTLV